MLTGQTLQYVPGQGQRGAQIQDIEGNRGCPNPVELRVETIENARPW